MLVSASIVPSSQFLVTLMMEAIRSSETSVLTRATQRHIPEDVIRNSSRHENFKSSQFAIYFRIRCLTAAVYRGNSLYCFQAQRLQL
jgi:hypothetical protein